MLNSIKLYTIGFTKKNAQTFFTLLKKHKIIRLIDIRLNNVSQLAGFTKKDDLQYFLKELCDIAYLHRIDLSPTEDILKQYKSNKITWNEYEKAFKELLKKRMPEQNISIELLNNSCLLCSEPTADKCHRRLVAEYLQTIYPELIIIHI